MKVAELFRQEPPFSEARRKLRAAIEAGKIAEDADAYAALDLVLDSLDKVELVMGLEEREADKFLRLRTVGNLLSLLDGLDGEYVSEHGK
jgi:acyl carrier protein